MKGLFVKVISRMRGFLVKKQFAGDGEVFFKNPLYRLKVMRGKNAKIVLRGKLTFSSFLGNNKSTEILLDEDATLEIDGDFEIGGGVSIYVQRGGVLKIGGREKEDKSGITCDSRIMVSKHVEIGKDFVCAWGCFISDCDWHQIFHGGVLANFQKDTIIGNHVWVAHGCSILKGSVIGDGCIVGCKSIVQQSFPENCLVVGCPAKVVRTDCSWKR